MGIRIGSIAATSAIWQIGLEVAKMNDKLYLATMHIAKKLLEQGTISKEEYAQIDTIFTEKYAPCLGSLFTDIDLL